MRWNPEPPRRPGHGMEDLVRAAQGKIRRGQRPPPEEAIALMHSNDVGGFLFGGVDMARRWCRYWSSMRAVGGGVPSAMEAIPPFFARTPHSLEAQLVTHHEGPIGSEELRTLFFWALRCRPGDFAQNTPGIDWIVAVRWGATDHYGVPAHWDAVPDTLEDYRPICTCGSWPDMSRGPSNVAHSPDCGLMQ